MHLLGLGIFFATCGIFLQSLTEWTFRQTPIFFTFHLLLGVLASLYYHKRKRQARFLERRMPSRSQEYAAVA
jgi:peptidoglycan/LPS O-acetylase OafA/YrhL